MSGRVYLAGPMTNLPLFNFPAFHEAAAVLRDLGYDVVSPAELDEGDGFDPATSEADTHLAYMRRDLAALMDCQGIVMLPGWESSKGAVCELTVARTCGLFTYAFTGDGVAALGTVAPSPAAVAVPPVRAGEVRVVNATTGGEKGAKPEAFGLLPWRALGDVARVYRMGSEKYRPHNWRKGYAWSLSLDAGLRHLAAFMEGEDRDPESGEPHLAHAAFHMLALLTFMREHPELDDRWKAAA